MENINEIIKKYLELENEEANVEEIVDFYIELGKNM